MLPDIPYVTKVSNEINSLYTRFSNEIVKYDALLNNLRQLMHRNGNVNCPHSKNPQTGSNFREPTEPSAEISYKNTQALSNKEERSFHALIQKE